ncbi:MAG: class I SAM-dependent methyltransferase [Candidatus Omnitrophica bacterium]|nr:class I SAM-dependent methyltransferase [Candidatus Omnitrophota bacterium]
MAISIVFFFDSVAYSLATLPASRNITARQHIEAAFKRRYIRFAKHDYEKRLLAQNGTSCLLLGCGRYLISEEVEASDLWLIQNIAYLDIQALLQILREKDRHRYNAIISLVLSHFPRTDDSIPLDLYAEDVISRAFQFLSPIHEKVLSESDIPPDMMPFIKNIKPVIAKNTDYFTEEFWKAEARGKYIRDTLNDGMIFYNAGSFLEAGYATRARKPASASYAIAGALAKRFLEKRKTDGIILNESHAEIIAGIIRRLVREDIGPDDDPDKVLAKGMKACRIKRILDMGCGDCSFLASMSEAALDAGVELVGVDQHSPPQTENVTALLRRANAKVIQKNASQFYDPDGFDIIIASGVMSLWGSLPSWQVKDAKMGYALYRKSLLNAYDLAQNASRLLSDNTKAAIYANSFNSMLMLNRQAVSEFVDIYEWDNSRRCAAEVARKDMGDELWRRRWVPLWEQAASFAVLTRKSSGISNVKDEASSGVEQTCILMGDLINAQLNDGSVYEIAYDTSRLSFAQRYVVEEYIELLRSRTDRPDNIKKRPFVKLDGSKESLFYVRCIGKSFSGEGRVDIEEVNLEKFLLKIPYMMNIAMAASTIPDCDTSSKLEPYLPILSYIKLQYNKITGKIMELPEIPSEIINKIRFIHLPKPERIDPYLLDEYNRISKDMLMSAA